MKRILAMLLLSAILLFAGCASSTTPEGSAEADQPSAFGNEKYVEIYNAVTEKISTARDVGTASRLLAPEYGMSAQQLAQLYSDISILVREGQELPDVLPLRYPATTYSSLLSEAKSPSEAMMTQYASENGLHGSPVLLVGTVAEHGVLEIEEGKTIDFFILETADGKTVVNNMQKYLIDYASGNSELEEEFGEIGADYEMPAVGEYVKVYAIYDGFSEKYDCPTFYYGISDYMYNLAKENDPYTSPDPVESAPADEESNNVSLTLGQINALEKALAYLKSSPFSYNRLVEQLEYSKFTHEEAVYAADHCGADWNEQAAKKAAAYLNMTAFSRQGLIDQLEYEGFTHDQAVYGVEANGY